MKNKEELLNELIENLAEMDLLEEGSYSHDCLKLEVEELWDQLNKLGMSTKELNQYCQEAGVL